MITGLVRKFKKTLQDGAVIGPFSKTEDPAMIEALGHAGFDFVIIDLEHGPNSIRSAQNLVRAAQLAGMLPIVRVKEGIPNSIGESLDIGAGGVQVPQVTNAQAARDVMHAARFAPDGMRGVCRYVRAAEYAAKDRAEYFREANEAVIVLQLEGREALENVAAILEVPGIDIVFVGPYDLSQSLGLTGQVDHPDVAAKVAEVARLGEAKGVAVGTFVESPEQAKRWMEQGVRYLCYSVDTGIMLQASRAILRQTTKQDLPPL